MKPPQIDTIIENLIAATTQFFKHVQYRTHQYRHHRNLTVPPISQLPIEVLSHILNLSISCHEWSVDRLQQLAQVSTDWKGVVLRTPALWSVVRVHTHGASKMWMRWRKNLNLALKKSKSVPLAVTFGQSGEELFGSFTRLDLDDFMTTAAEHAARWQAVSYTGPWSSAVEAAFARPCPKLEELKIELEEPSDPTSRALPVVWGCSLRHVHVRNAVIPWESLTGLVTLKIYDIKTSPDDIGLTRIEDFLEMLQSMPNLELLYLIRKEETVLVEDGETESAQRYLGGTTTTAKTIHLPRLTDLQMKHISESLVSAMLTRVHAEKVTSLSLRVHASIARMLPPANCSTFVTPAFSRAITLSSSLHIKHYGAYVCAESYHADDYLDEE